LIATLTILYLLLTVIAGIYTSRKIVIAEDFALAARKLPIQYCKCILVKFSHFFHSFDFLVIFGQVAHPAKAGQKNSEEIIRT